MEVAVKSIKQTASDEMRVKFLQEAAIMGQFKHPNILNVLGIVLEDPVSLCVCARVITVVILYNSVCYCSGC